MSGGFDPSKIIEAARNMKTRFEKIDEELAKKRIEADAGAGMVRVIANGLGEIIDVKIDPLAAGGGDVPMLEDLVKSAVNEAIRRAKALAEDERKKMFGGLQLPFDPSSLGGLF